MLWPVRIRGAVPSSVWLAGGSLADGKTSYGSCCAYVSACLFMVIFGDGGFLVLSLCQLFGAERVTGGSLVWPREGLGPLPW